MASLQDHPGVAESREIGELREMLDQLPDLDMVPCPERPSSRWFRRMVDASDVTSSSRRPTDGWPAVAEHEELRLRVPPGRAAPGLPRGRRPRRGLG